MDYPHELMFPSGRVAPGMIRLKVAAVVACIDTGSIEGTEIEESDLQAFLGPRQAWHEAHAFVNIEPTGNLGRLTAQTIDALCASIRAGEIKPLRLRMKLNGEIDTRETWLLVDDFDLWCERRNLDSGDNMVQYMGSEVEIHLAAMTAADEKRAEFETIDFEGAVKQRAYELDSPDVALNLLKENIALRASASRKHESDKPLMTRERHTLLAIIAVLCKEAKLDYSKTSKTAEIIENMSDLMGINVSKRGVDEHLKKIPYALAARAK